MMPDYKTEIEPLPGWCSEAKFKDIYETVVAMRPTLCVEIGVFGGRSLLAFAEALSQNQHGYVYGIDPYRKECVQEGGDGAANHDWWTQSKLNEIFDDLYRLMCEKKIFQYAALIRESSETALRHGVIRDPIDILHIDGNHSELGSTRDVELYLPKVKPGGLIYFDDINWPTTLKAQGMLAEKCDLLRTVDFCNVYRKR